MILNINGVETTIVADDSSYRHRAIMGENSLTLTFALPGYLDIPVGSFCTFQGETYTLTEPQNFKKNNTRNFEYTLILDSAQSQLDKYKFRDTGSNRLKFSLTARPQEHLKMLVDNLNLRDSGWTVGSYTDAAEKSLSFNHNYCSDAMRMMAEAFETDWEVTGKTINLRKVEYNKTTPLALSYGRGNGFKPGVGRTNRDSSRPAEILFVQGGSRNIDPSKYGTSELLLPKNQQHSYEGRIYQSDTQGLSIRRADKALKSMEEDSLDLSNIYPSRVGVVSSTVAVNVDDHFYDFIDSSIPEALNFKSCLIAGETMTVIFQTGMLAGKELETSYDHATRRFALVPQEIDGVTMPDELFKPVAGDKYAVFGIQLPDAYVCDNATKTGGSWDMMKQACKYLYENEDPRFSFTGELDGIWAKAHWLNVAGKIKLGGYVSFTDAQFQTSAVLIRIIGIKDYINNPYKPQLELSNVTVGQTVASDLAKLETTEVVVERLHKDAIQFTKRRYRDAKETIQLLSNSLLNYSGSISPIAVHTMQMLVGDESLQFRFVNNKVNPATVAHQIGYNNTAKLLSAEAGILQHMSLGIASISSSHAASEYKFWDMTPFVSPFLADPTAYYLYAKVSKAATTTGEFLLSPVAIAIEDVPGYYHLLTGILNSEQDGERSFVTLYGFTEILPGRITTDRLVSADGLNFLDFINNAFHVGNANTYLDWNSRGDGKLRIKGTLLQSESGAEAMPGVFRGAYLADVTYYEGDEVTYVGSTYRFTSASAGSGFLPTDQSHWITVAAAGTNGTNGTNGDSVKGDPGSDGAYFEYIYAKNGSTTAAPALVTTNTAPAGWTTAMPDLVSFEYLWVSSTKKTAAGALLQNWGTPVRVSGKDGINGPPGSSGAAMAYAGVYDNAKTYNGSNLRVDAVKYDGIYYLARTDAGTFSGVLPTDPSKWNPIGAQFEQVATNLLLAEQANIADWIVKSGKITSQNNLSDGVTPKAILDGENGGMTLKSEVTTYSPTGGRENIIQTIDLDSDSAKLEARSSNNEVAYISSQGIFANRAGVEVLSATTGMQIKAAVGALGFGNLEKDAYGLDNAAICGVYGYSSNSYKPSDNAAPSWGGMFYKLLVSGLYLRTMSAANTSLYLDELSTYISCYNTQTLYIFLPSAPQKGQVILIQRMYSSLITVFGNGYDITVPGVVDRANVGLGSGDKGMFVFNGGYWNYNYMPR